MTTQSLRGMANHGPMHWRGDRTGGNDAAERRSPNSGAFDERRRVQEVQRRVRRPARPRRGSSPTSDMEAFTDFILQVTYPPNPIRNLDNSLTPSQQAGRDFFIHARMTAVPTDRCHACNGCHPLDPNGNAEFGVAAPASSAPTGATRSRPSRRSSRSRTSATCTRRSACSAWRTTFTIPGHEPVLPHALLHPGTTAALHRRPGARIRLPPRRRVRHDVPFPRHDRLRSSTGRSGRSLRTRAASRHHQSDQSGTGGNSSSSPTSRCAGRSRRSCSPSTPTWRPSSVSRRPDGSERR